MSALTMLLALMLSAVLEAILPVWGAAGRASMPIVLAVVLYYALYYPPSYLWTAAILGGLLQDSLGLVPLGYSAVGFCVVALIATHFREVMFVHEFWSHVWIGAFGALLSTCWLSLLLKSSGLLGAALGWLAVRWIGAFVLGAFCVPAVMALMAAVDQTLGNVRMGDG
jgi:rod shape-determining protein MreD